MKRTKSSRRSTLPRLAVAVALGLALASPAMPALAQMRGHGGPVRAVALSEDGRIAVSGSFDQSVILWDVETGAALGVQRFHEGAVNAVAALAGGLFASASEDGRIALWRLGQAEPERSLAGHAAPVVALSASPDGTRLASASWDETARIWPLSGEAPRVLQGHKGPVNAVGFLPDGRVVTAGADATVRIWPREDARRDAQGNAPGDGDPAIVTLSSPLSALAVTGDGEIAVSGSDAVLRFLKPDGTLRASLELGSSPVIALAPSPDGARIAAATAGGAVVVVAREPARVLLTLVGPGLPAWSVAWRPEGDELVTGGGDRLVRRWDATRGEPIGSLAMTRPNDPLAAYHGDRGAEVFRACVACHALQADEGNRAGPNLTGIMGRRIATAPGYRYSEPLKRLDIVWDARTIAELFEVGPARYTPGTKMPEQRITSAEDRAALVRFLEKATAPR